MATLKYWLWLTTRQGMNARQRLMILDHFGAPETAYFADPAEYDLTPSLTPRGRKSLEDKSLDSAEHILEACQRLGIRILTLQDAGYPERLRQIFDPPAVLYVRGRTVAFDEEVAIGMVGSRAPSVYGEKMAGKLGFEVARGGGLVVSGIARGLDSCALVGALKGGGTVAAVLGCGIDVVYPPENHWLYEDVAASGLLISEYPPGTEPTGFHFPIRNRILSGLCLGVVAVEAALHSGTLITARLALEQDRDLFAVPGNADAPMSRGTNRLIQQGAGLVTCGWDILGEYQSQFPDKIRAPGGEPLAEEAVRLTVSHPEPLREQERKQKTIDKIPEEAYIELDMEKSGIPEEQWELLQTLDEKPLTADELVELTQIPAGRVRSALTLLQIQGYVEELPGRRFQTKVRLRE